LRLLIRWCRMMTRKLALIRCWYELATPKSVDWKIAVQGKQRFVFKLGTGHRSSTSRQPLYVSSKKLLKGSVASARLRPSSPSLWLWSRSWQAPRTLQLRIRWLSWKNSWSYKCFKVQSLRRAGEICSFLVGQTLSSTALLQGTSWWMTRCCCYRTSSTWLLTHRYGGVHFSCHN
jgi:hypothetical protein